MSFSARGGRVRLADKQDLEVGDHPFTINVKAWASVALQWRLPAISGIVDATIAVYSSCDEWSDESLNPPDATNPAWTLEPAAVFSTSPGESTLSAQLTLSDNPWLTLMAVVTVINPLEGFSLVASGL